MNSNKLLFIVLLLLAGISLFFYFGKGEKKSTLVEHFALEDTSVVKKIIMNTKSFNDLSLVKTNEGWIINTKFKADPIVVNQLLNTAKRVKVSYSVPKESNKYVLDEVKKLGTHIKYYDSQDNLIKEYWVGKASSDNTKTYFWDEEVSTVKACAIQGFDGFLEYRFLINETEWRDRSVFRSQLSQIKKLKVVYPERTQSSFEINVFNRDSFELKPLEGEAQDSKLLNKQKVMQYMTFYKNINCEGYSNDNPRKDSIMNAVPLADIYLEEFTGKTFHAKVYHREINRRSKSMEDKLGNPLKYDVDKYWGTINDGKDLVIMQQFSFGKLFKEYSDFFN